MVKGNQDIVVHSKNGQGFTLPEAIRFKKRLKWLHEINDYKFKGFGYKVHIRPLSISRWKVVEIRTFPGSTK
jgi:hypothetical protein